MNDRELLELAAKAAGIDLAHLPWEHNRGDGVLTLHGWIWSPLTDDGQALRLAVKLGLLVDVRYTRPEAARYNEVMYWPTPVKGERIVFGDGEMDPAAATRRAIVRAAAALGSVEHGSGG